MLRKRLICFILSCAMVCGSAVNALADTESEIRAHEAENTAALNSTMSEIEGDVAAQSALQSEISDLDNQLVNLMSQIDFLNTDIANTEQKIADAKTALAAAEEVRDTQYSDMKTRIRYIYERNENLSWFTYIASSTDFIDFLNRIYYTQQLNQYDRELLSEYQACVAEINELKVNLENSADELREEKHNLEEQQAALDASLAEKRAKSQNYDEEIAALRAKADALTAEIAAQNAALQEIEIEKARKAEEEARKRAEEEARRRAEEEAARQAAAEEAARQAAAAEAAAQAAAQQAAAADAAARQAAQEAADRAAAEAAAAQQAAAEAAAQQAAAQQAAAEEAARQAAAQQAAEAAAAQQAASQSSGNAHVWTREEAFARINTAGGHSGMIGVCNQIIADANANNSDPNIGQRVVDYACQFLGNPYVLGGESLTNGCDCAGFAKEVYAHFGVYFPRIGPVIENLGVPVGSLAEARPGDIIMYYGHTAIYMGNDMVVNASSPEVGICTRSPATYRAIYRIRRIFYGV